MHNLLHLSHSVASNNNHISQAPYKNLKYSLTNRFFPGPDRDMVRPRFKGAGLGHGGRKLES